MRFGPTEARPRTSEWRPGPATLVLWTVSGVVLTLAGLYLFALPYAATHGEIGFVRDDGELLLAAVASTVIALALFALHEWVHGLAMRGFGVVPRYGIEMAHDIMPCLYCTAPGHKFTRTQFTLVSAAPAVLLSLAGGLLVAFAPFGGWLVLPLAVHLGGCVADLWFLAVVLRQPRSTLFEDLKVAVRMHHSAP